MLVESRSFSSQPDYDIDRTPVGGGRPIEVGLVNNMPDAALKDTERQFRALLELASGAGLSVRLHLLSLASVVRGAEARALMRGRYVEVGEEPGQLARQLSGLSLDALIVTGAEPKAKALRDESYWPQFVRLMDWAERHTVSTICSCLAAHAAALHFDRIERRPLGFKLSGVFESWTEGDHALLRDLPARVATPHSRYNELCEGDLRRAGFSILTNSRDAGVDMFAKTRGKCTFLFFQGHPEYQPRTLLREYRRDVLRYLNGERADYPLTPANYFEPSVCSRLAQFETRAKARRRPDLAAALPLPGDENTGGATAWAATAALVYRNWLRHVAQAKQAVEPLETRRAI